jgi:hypothetical protein
MPPKSKRKALFKHKSVAARFETLLPVHQQDMPSVSLIDQFKIAWASVGSLSFPFDVRRAAIAGTLLLIIFLLIFYQFYFSESRNGAGMLEQLQNPQEGLLLLDCREWYGRLGNNIVSFLSAAIKAHSLSLAFAVTHDCRHYAMDMTLFHMENTSQWELRRKMTASESFAGDILRFPGTDPEEWLIRFPNFAHCLLQPLLHHLFHKIARNSSFAADDTIVIHIRSGDVLGEGGVANTNIMYADPPLAYYIDIIERNKNKDILIITNFKEASVPSILVTLLLQRYPKITLTSGNLDEDLGYILSASHLVISQGTFAWGVGLASPRLKNLYMFHLPKFNFDMFAFPRSRVTVYKSTEDARRFSPAFNVTAYVHSTDRKQLVTRVIESRHCSEPVDFTVTAL